MKSTIPHPPDSDECRQLFHMRSVFEVECNASPGLVLRKIAEAFQTMAYQGALMSPASLS